MFPILLLTTVLLSDTDADIIADRQALQGDASCAEQLAQTLIRHHDALTAISLVYTSAPESRVGHPKGNYWRRAIAVSHSDMFKSDNSHGHSRMHWSADLNRKTLVVTAEEATLLENLNRAVVELTDKSTHQAFGVVESEIVFDMLCWWPFTNWSPPQVYGHAYSMRGLLSESSYRLLENTEFVETTACHPPFRTSRFHYLRFSGGGQPAMACGSVAEGRGQRP